jgi:hypothetical protein
MRVLHALAVVLNHRLHELVKLIIECRDEREMKKLSRRHREVERLIQRFSPDHQTK